jgi:hypothetical protein
MFKRTNVKQQTKKGDAVIRRLPFPNFQLQAPELPALFAFAVAAATSTATTAAASAAATAGRFRPGFIHVQRPTPHFVTVDSGDGAFAFSVIAHFDEAKTARLSRLTVCDDADAVNLSVSLKEWADILLGRTEAQIPYKNVFHDSSFWFESGPIREGLASLNWRDSQIPLKRITDLPGQFRRFTPSVFRNPGVTAPMDQMQRLPILFLAFSFHLSAAARAPEAMVLGLRSGGN